MAKDLKIKNERESFIEVKKIIERLEDDEIKYIEREFKPQDDTNKPIYQKLYFQIKENETIEQTQKDNFETLREKIEELIGKYTRKKELELENLEEQLKEKIATVKSLRKKGVLKAAKRNLDKAIDFAIKNKIVNCFYELYQLRVDIHFLLKIQDFSSKENIRIENTFVKICENIDWKSDELIKKELESEFVRKFSGELLSQYSVVVEIFIKELFINKTQIDLHGSEIPFNSLELEYFKVKKDYKSFISFYENKKREINKDIYLDIYDLRLLLLELDKMYNMLIIGKYDENIHVLKDINLKYQFDKSKLYSVLGYFLHGKINDIEISYNLKNKIIPFPNSFDEILHFSKNQIPLLSLRFELNNLLHTFLSSIGNSYQNGFESCHGIISELVELDFVKENQNLFFDLYLLDLLIEQYNNPENAYDIIYKFKCIIDSKRLKILEFVKDNLDNTKESIGTIYKRHNLEWEYDNPIHSAVKYFLDGCF